jgi:hypothetical protein
LKMLNHAQADLHLAGLLLLVDFAAHPGPPGRGKENTPSVRDVY